MSTGQKWSNCKEEITKDKLGKTMQLQLNYARSLKTVSALPDWY